MPQSDRVRSKKERKILREALKKEGIVAKVSKSGVAYDILVNNDMQKPELPPIGATFHQNQGLKKERTNESISDCCPRETLLIRERAVLQIQRVQFAKMRIRREEVEVPRKAEVERQIEEKQQQAKRRREEKEKMQRERLKRRNLK
uniref:Uncharacterized protein n=1 Tax=Magallana gigas TaxID=29159 RepID=K1Q2R8_MAGGI